MLPLQVKRFMPFLEGNRAVHRHVAGQAQLHDRRRTPALALHLPPGRRREPPLASATHSLEHFWLACCLSHMHSFCLELHICCLMWSSSSAGMYFMMW